MANSTLKTRIVINNKPAADWGKDTETIWLKGEFLVESDTRKIKIGDGVNKYSALKYANMTPEEVDALVKQSSHSHSNKAILDATTASFTTALKSKLDGIAAGAEANVQSDWNILDSSSDAFIKNKPTSMPASDVHEWAKAETKPTYTATEVGADPTGSSAKALTDAKSYADKKVADLVNGAPGTMDTLKEVSDALDANKDVVDALNAAIGNKANQSDLTAHTGNVDIHVTKEKKTAWDSAATHAGTAHAPSNAERNTIVSVKKNGEEVVPGVDRSVDIKVPTKTSELTNDSGYITKAYVHPTGDGNLHVPATGTINNGKVLKAGATAGSATWSQLTKSDVGLNNVDNTADANKNVATAVKLKTARNVNVSGAVTGTAIPFDGSADAIINVTSVNAIKLVLNPGDTLILDGTI
ncbi:hypothetical protein [Mediterraneibacter gnavus]|uniref:hypothetical protein n=1 Tax=Mediterraneibacter gnavus TaxID=33038 RepID=UPI001922A7A7|nr:hypothetical protein [Mediterraneibacter gnavus]